MFAAKNTAAPSGEAVYIESVFSTFLYTGNGSTQTINNGIDLAGKGGLVWTKSRSNATSSELRDTLRGVTKSLRPDSAAAEATDTGNALTAFNSDGFSLGADTWFTTTNVNGRTYASWTFREQAKFFDVVTYTGNGSNRTIAHNLGSVPGCIMVKRTDTTAAWAVYHRSLANTEYLVLNTTAAKATGATYWNSTTPTSTEFSLGTSTDVNASGGTYVAYLFAHDAGGFGAAGTDNVISCGSFNGASAGSVSLGYEPQWILFKDATSTTSWVIYDVMRGWSVTSGNYLLPNSSGAEANTTSLYPVPNATGFSYPSGMTSGNTIYIAIRRGPMKTPTSGTSVFAPTIWTGNTPNVLDTRSISGFGKPTDLFIGSDRDTAFNHNLVYDRLRGTDTTGGKLLYTHNTSSEADNANSGSYSFAQMDGITLGNYVINYSGRLDVGWFFGRAPGFFDVVCYTGTGANRTVTHNLGVAPELMIIKARDSASDWVTWQSSISILNRLRLNTTQAVDVNNTQHFGGTLPTSSVFSVGSTNSDSGINYVAYLFASVNGVSKVGSYTGNGSSQTINCGFAAGARFVLIKRTSSTGDWYVWDTARGIVSGNDPRLSLNTTAAEVTTDDSIDPDNSGFIVNQLSATNINVNAASYIFLAVS